MARYARPPEPGANDPLLTRPGEVLFRRAERLQELASFPAFVRDRWCMAGTVPDRGRLPPPVSGLRALAEGPDPASEPFAYAVMTTAAAAFGAGDANARQALAGLLDVWARADALTRIETPSANVYYALDRTLLPIIVAFALLRADPTALTPDRRARVERWLGKVEALRGRERRLPSPREVTARNNHYYLRASVSMAWGALTGDESAFRQGSEAYLQALHDMRPDGSLPLETRRSVRALWYQRHALASLVTIAEMAAVQGQDLYGRAVDGKDIHTGVRFLLDAIDDPERVRAYAETGGEPQDLGFLVRRGHGRHYMAWAEPYIARFPEHPESRRLLALLRRAGSDFRPMIDDYSGGDTTCFFAKLREEAAIRGAREPTGGDGTIQNANGPSRGRSNRG
ncbi:alginate lyase family protein [Benzoatithermus flavus]|uniref:Alginate lyase family protein n=1 Tax=Benzoatithermus flavus TaxID=3108223 RepID=A0ABU8XPE5_9PROT